MVKTPEGVRDILPQETKERVKVLDTIGHVFAKEGYEQIMPPTFENYDYIKSALAPSLDKETLKFFSPEGQLMVMRPDFTTSIARVVATRMKHTQAPIRLFYSGDVYRIKKFATESQFHQTGIELFNTSVPEGDNEILKIAEEVMTKLKIKTYKIVKNNVSYVKELPEKEQKMIHNMDFVSLGRLPNEAEVVPGDIDYYTGLYFEIYVDGIGYPIGSGGRYDKLLGNFGDTRNAVGFAINLSRLMEALKRSEK